MPSFAQTDFAFGARLPVEPTGEAGQAHRSFDGAKAFDVAIIGAGVIGLSIGWRLARKGLSVISFDRAEAGGGASLAATGMLAAAAEHEPGGDELALLAVESQRLWPQFCAELESDSGVAIDYRGEGTLVVALQRDEVERLRFRYEQQRRSGLAAVWLNGAEVRAREPGLRPSVAAGLFCADDHQIDPRRMMPALRRAFAVCGGLLIEHCPVERLDLTGGRVSGLLTAAGLCQAAQVVLATGAWSGEEALLPPGLFLPVRPLKGQALALRTNAQTGNLIHVVWSEQVHLAPKRDGRLILGATMEECGFDQSVSAGALYALLEGGRRLLPSIEDMQLEALWSGFRPTSDDDAPILGPAGLTNFLVATGHHRNGFLLAPVTAAAIEDCLSQGAMGGAAAAFGIERFAERAKRVESRNADHRQWAETGLRL